MKHRISSVGLLILVIFSMAIAAMSQKPSITSITLYYPDGKTETFSLAESDEALDWKWQLRDGCLVYRREPKTTNYFCGTFKAVRTEK